MSHIKLQRYSDYGPDGDMLPDRDGMWVEYHDIESLIKAVESLMKARSRFHTEASYKVLESVVKDMEK